jgi:hypothetical protein
MKLDQNIDNYTHSVAIGVKNLDKIGNYDKAFTIEMLNKFLDASKECVEGISRSLKKHNWPKLRNIAHKNIPSYRLMGLGELAGFLKYIEHNALKKEKRKNISRIVRSIRKKNEDVISAIKNYLNLIDTEDLKLSIN